MAALTQTNFKFPKQTNFYKGKVRDVYTIDNKYLVMIASDRISAFDVVLPKGIPFKGQILNQIASKFLTETKDILPNWVLSVPDPIVTIGKFCEPFKVEMVVRGYLSGHAWREYKLGKRAVCGVAMPNGLSESDKFPVPIITPTTKASVGHDEDISREEIIKQNIVSESDYIQLEKYTQALYQRGNEIVNKNGLILVDTKYEFGKVDGQIYLMDEIHTPDSSRYFYLEGYEEKQKQGLEQKQLSKEFVRQWLISNNFQGKTGDVVPQMTDEVVNSISARYTELFEKVTGDSFVFPTETSEKQILERVERNVLEALKKLD